MENKQATINLCLDVFEGPLDLLLYLIKKNDLDISKISVAKITDQYLQYLEGLKELEIDIASDYLLMASELAHIKSRSLLPHSEEEESEEEDSADNLVARLKEYERFKMAAEGLKERHWLHRDVFSRQSFGTQDDSQKAVKKVSDDGQFEVDVFELIQAFAEVMSKIPVEERDYQVTTERVSITQRIYEVLDFLKDKDSVLFLDLFSADDTRQLRVVTFLSVLEMVKLNVVHVFQTEAYAPIRIQRHVDLEADALESEDVKQHLESYR